MQILIQPMYSKQELNGDSNYVVYSALIRAMLTVRPKWHWFVLFPDSKSGYKYDYDGLFDQPNVTRIAQHISTRKFANAVSYDASWYDELFRSYGFDLILCNLVEVSGHLRLAGERGFDDTSRPVVVASHHYMIHESLPYPFDSMENVALAQVAGGILADYNIFNSQHCRWMYQDTAKKWFNERAIAGVLKKSTCIYQGTLESDLPMQKPHDGPPIIIYNHRLQGYKNFDVTFTLFEKLASEGIPFKVRYTSSSAEHTAKIAHYPFVEIKLCARRAEYLDAIQEGDLNVTNSQHETFCISAVESMAMGQPLVAPAAVTFPEITGQKETHYPYLFTDPNEQYQMVKKLLLDADERKRWGAILADYTRTRFNSLTWAENHATLFETLTKDRVPIIQEDVLPHLMQIVKQTPITLEKFVNEARALRVNGRTPYGPQSLTYTKAMKVLNKMGYMIRTYRGIQKVVLAR
jgi:glycosyltransferase involved in cell wall biosynthesis